MTRRFIIAVDPLTAAQEKKLKEVFGGAAWWHWLPNFWLVKDRSDQLTVEFIRDSISQINNSARAIVIAVTSHNWGGLVVPDANGREMDGWLKNIWDND